MWRVVLVLCSLMGFCFGDSFEGPIDLSLKFFNELSIHGAAKLKMVKAKSLEVQGPLEFNRLDVQGKAEVFGEFRGQKGKFGRLSVQGEVKADHVVCHDLFIKGSATLSYLEVANQADIEGPFTGTHCRIKDLKVQAEQIVLDTVEIGSILVKKGSLPETLTLKNATIKGDIVFESGRGTIKIEGNAVNIQGKIKGSATRGDAFNSAI